jgi:type IV pilus assembly protein PilC
MPVFTYQGVNAAGEKVQGERAAENKQVLRAALARERVQAGVIKEKGAGLNFNMSFGGSVKAKETAIFFRQFSVMIDAGLPLVQCLEILGNNQENQFFKKVLTGIRTSVEGGSTLSDSMRAYPKVFDDLTTNMIEAGEAGGILDAILQRISAYVEKSVKLRSQVKSALVYPVSVIVIALLVVGGLLKFVVPVFANLFVGLGVALPASTQFVINLSAFISSFWWLIFLIVGGIVFSIRYIRTTPQGKYTTDLILLRLPVFGTVLRKIGVARFTRTLGTLISSGVPILDGLSITARTAGNAVIERALLQVRKSIEEGRTVVDPLRESGVFPNMVTQMIGVGEATGAMDSMLAKIADFYEDEVDAATKDLMALMEPMLISFLGVVVGGIVISLYMPLFSMISKLSGGGG